MAWGALADGQTGLHPTACLGSLPSSTCPALLCCLPACPGSRRWRSATTLLRHDRARPQGRQARQAVAGAARLRPLRPRCVRQALPIMPTVSCRSIGRRWARL